MTSTTITKECHVLEHDFDPIKVSRCDDGVSKLVSYTCSKCGKKITNVLELDEDE